jgi:UDP-glucose 4-epimerase
MKVLLTGAFGNVGTSALEELTKRGHQVRCFDLKTKANQRAAKRFRGPMEVVWGDLRQPEAVAGAVRDQDMVVHLAFIIPKMSATGVESERRPQWAREINIGGTRNLLNAMQALSAPPKLIFTSSYHVFGRTQEQLPPRTVADPTCPTEHYSRHKVACERMIETSGLPWSIFRLAATLPLAIQLDPGMFDVPLWNRMEFVHTRDVGVAIAHGVTSDEIWGKTLLIGGGPRCQYTYREIVQDVLAAMGVGMLPDEAFSSTPFATDWVDSTESQRLLRYQRRDLQDYIAEMVELAGFRRRLIRCFRPFVRCGLLMKSPYYRRAKLAWPRRAPARTSA